MYMHVFMCVCVNNIFIYVKILYNNIVKIHGHLICYLYVALTRGQNYKKMREREKMSRSAKVGLLKFSIHIVSHVPLPHLFRPIQNSLTKRN